MDKKEQMSDEQLAKYMSGKASPEEEAVVLDFLAENDENLDDFLNMTVAIELQQGQEKKGTAGKTWKKIAWGVSSAAAVAVLIIVGVLAFNHDNNGDEQFAQQEQTPHSSEDNTTTTALDTSDYPTDKTKTQPVMPNDGLTPAIRETRHYADGVQKNNYVKMLFPATERISISNEKKSVIFRWSTDACKVHLTVASNDGQTLVDEYLVNEKNYKLNIESCKQNLQWNAAFYFSDGSTILKNGNVFIENQTDKTE